MGWGGRAQTPPPSEGPGHEPRRPPSTHLPSRSVPAPSRCARTPRLTPEHPHAPTARPHPSAPALGPARHQAGPCPTRTCSLGHDRGVAGAQSKQLGPESLQRTLILLCGCSPHRKGSLYTRRASPEPRAVEGVPSGTPRPPDQPAQGLSAGSPLPQLRKVQGVTEPTPLAGGISSSFREPQVASSMAVAPGELGTRKHTCEQGAAGNSP